MPKRGLAGEKSPMKRRKINTSEIVKLIVGGQKRQFSIRGDVLCETSKFFQTALDGRWSEAKSGIIRMKEMRSAPFSTYVHWLRRKRLDISTRTNLTRQTFRSTMLYWP